MVSVQVTITIAGEKGSEMKDWIIQALTEAEQRRAASGDYQDRQRERAKKLDSDAPTLFSALLDTLIADIAEINKRSKPGITPPLSHSALDAYSTSTGFSVTQDLAPRLGFIISYDDKAKIIKLHYTRRTNGSTENMSATITLRITLDDRDDEPGIYPKGSPAGLTVNELSRKLLMPLVVSDVQEIRNQGLLPVDQ